MHIAHLYLLDTNIASYIMRCDKPHLEDRIKKIQASSFAVSVVTEAELRFGAARKVAPQRLKAAVNFFLERMKILPWDSAAAKVYATLNAELEEKGKLLDDLDAMIAAHALALEATLVTNDKGFSRIKELKVEDWTKA